MKKIVASVGVAALGASTLHAAVLPSLTAEGGKPWSISATLRGFYDDNFNSAPDAADLGRYERDSFGFEIAPSISVMLPLGQTSLGLGYTYSYKNYENRTVGSDSHDDSSHTFDLSLDHAFNQRYGVAVRDSFVIGQEPDLLRTGNAMTTFQRVPGDNIRNYGSIDFKGQLTELLGFEVGYGNTFHDYEDDGVMDAGGQVYPSLSGLLDRLEHTIHLDGHFNIQPQTTLILGYQFRGLEYTGDEAIAGPYPLIPGFNVKSDVRNSQMHYGYVGANHAFRPDLSGAVKVGFQYTDYYNDPSTDSTVSPYVMANLRYSYLPECFAELGVTHDRNATDVVGYDNSGITLDQESTVVYLSVSHRITQKLRGTLLGQYQNSSFNGGLYDSENEDYYMAGVNLEYQFTQNLSAQVGYNYDLLDSDLGDIRDLHRNRVYLGITARY